MKNTTFADAIKAAKDMATVCQPVMLLDNRPDSEGRGDFWLVTIEQGMSSVGYQRGKVIALERDKLAKEYMNVIVLDGPGVRV